MTVEWNKFASSFVLDEATKKRLTTVYPFFERELIKMEVWYIANPRKQKKNHFRFMVNWLNRVNKVERPDLGNVKRDYKKEEKEFREKMERAVTESAPPPDSWREMINKLRPA